LVLEPFSAVPLFKDVASDVIPTNATEGEIGPRSARHVNGSAAKIGRWFPVVAIVLAVAIHLPTLDQPLLDKHAFRQTQTAYTARIFGTDGIDLLHSKLPVLGPPWEVPFEFPLYQAAAAVVMDAGVPEDRALRSTALAWFTLSAVLLYLLVRRQTGSLGGSVALSAFLFSPFALVWSREALIEYLAVAACLLFALAGLRWRDRGSWAWYVVTILAGTIAMLVKITTGLFWILPFALLGFRSDADAERRRSRVATALTVIIPLVIGLAWTRYADGIKSASAATAVLTSGALSEWNVGTVEQRLDPVAWVHAFRAVVLLAGGVILPVVVIVAARFAVARGQIRFWAWMGIALVSPVIVFFNLYGVHDYYAAAVTPAAAAMFGAAAVQVASWRSRWARPVLIGAALTWVLVVVMRLSYWAPMYEPVVDPDGVLPLAAQIERETEPDRLVAILGWDWSPEILYYAHRWGWMVRGDTWPPGLLDRLFADGYAVYRCPLPEVGVDRCEPVSPSTNPS
jgi:hypothetical protein